MPMFVRRYRDIGLLALPIGFVLGAVLYLLFVLSGNREWRTQLTPDEVARSVVSYGLIGVLVALAALAGGAITVGLKDRRFQRPQSVRILWAAMGAAVGVVVLGIGAEIVGASTTSSTWFGFMVYLSCLLAVPAAVVAAVLVAVAERRSHRRPHRVDNSTNRRGTS